MFSLLILEKTTRMADIPNLKSLHHMIIFLMEISFPVIYANDIWIIAFSKLPWDKLYFNFLKNFPPSLCYLHQEDCFLKSYVSDCLLGVWIRWLVGWIAVTYPGGTDINV